jgi:catechol 2,3-dioxygenase-like lactoylglutathione lyase family enzyme
MKPIFLVLGAVLLCGSLGFAAESPTREVDYLKGLGINVTDTERSTKFYTETFGLKVAAVVPQGPIKDAKEVVLTVSGEFDFKGTPTLSLTHMSSEPLPAGRTAYGRMVIFSSNAEAIATRARAAGAKVRQTTKNSLFVTDPDGYEIEIYQPPG